MFSHCSLNDIVRPGLPFAARFRARREHVGIEVAIRRVAGSTRLSRGGIRKIRFGEVQPE